MTQFEEKVIEIVSQISAGKTLTYKEVATRAERTKASRAVGNILNRHYKQNGAKIPCHRVIRSDGGIGGYALGERTKEKLLAKEGVKIKN